MYEIMNISLYEITCVFQRGKSCMESSNNDCRQLRLAVQHQDNSDNLGHGGKLLFAAVDIRRDSDNHLS